MTGSAGHDSAIDEVRGVFPSDAALQDAIGRLTQAGFDRADLSLPEADAARDAGSANPNTDVDSRQLRTMGTGMAASAGALAAAGAVVASGGLAAPVVAAAIAGGVGAGAASHAVQRDADQAQHEQREEAADEGALVLAVHLRDPHLRPVAERAMEEAGATRLVAVVRTGAADSAGWTG
jgi:hypothetical protein